MARAFSERLPRIYRMRWPKGPYRVDVVRYANFFEAYETDWPFVHIVLSSEDPYNKGLGSLETLYHEASHSIVYPDDGTVGKAILFAARAANRPEPDQFWHAVIFYTTGSVAKSIFKSSGAGRYTMFADAAGLFTGTWASYRAPLGSSWQSYLDGRGSLEGALQQAVDKILKQT